MMPIGFLQLRLIWDLKSVNVIIRDTFERLIKTNAAMHVAENSFHMTFILNFHMAFNWIFFVYGSCFRHTVTMISKNRLENSISSSYYIKVHRPMINTALRNFAVLQIRLVLLCRCFNTSPKRTIYNKVQTAVRVPAAWW